MYEEGSSQLVFDKIATRVIESFDFWFTASIWYLKFQLPKGKKSWLFRKQIVNVWIDLQYMYKICSDRIHTWREIIISFSLLDKNIWFRQVLLTRYLQSEITLYTEKHKHMGNIYQTNNPRMVRITRSEMVQWRRGSIYRFA